MAALITSGQKTQCIRVVEDAARKATEQILGELEASGNFTPAAAQRVLTGGNKIKIAVKDAVRRAITELVTFPLGVLKCISAGQKVTIAPTDGTETLAEADDVFNWIDTDLKGWGTKVKSEPTSQTLVDVYEMSKDADFHRIFGSFGQNLDCLCLTQGQIKQFVCDHGDWLHPQGWATFFLFKANGEYFVASVRRRAVAHRAVDVYRLSFGRVWRAAYRRRVVVPQLILEN